MTELTFKSAGVSAREIDLSGPAEQLPIGVPAGIIGTSVKGPAFVPVTMAAFRDFIIKFGDTDGEKFGPLAVNEWLRNSQAVTYIRVLGVGDGKQRTSTGDNIGKVTNAGFAVGQRLVQSNGLIGENSYAVSGAPLGRTHFLGCFMSESVGSTVFSDAGIQKAGSNVAHPIIRGILMAPSGVVLMLSATAGGDSSAPTSTAVATSAGPKGFITGTVKLSNGTQEFVMLLNGHKGTDPSFSNVLTASFDMTVPNYFGNIFNKDPLKIEQSGHYLYAQYDVHPTLANITGSGVFHATASFDAANQEDLAFLTTGSLSRDAGSSTVPNYENFEDRFTTPKTPYVISQKFGGTNKDLFQVLALSDGIYANNKFKISIQNIAKSNVTTNKFGTFDLIVRDINDDDVNPIILEQFRGLSLNPSSDRYIARVIGDQKVFFDFDKSDGSQRLAIEGNHPNKSNLIRVKLHADVENGEVPEEALPVGFRGFSHSVTSGSVFLTTAAPHIHGAATNRFDVGQSESLKRAIEPPVPFRKNITVGTDLKKQIKSQFHWGVQFEHQTDLNEPNKSSLKNKTIQSFAKYIPNFMTTNRNFSVGENVGTADANGTILDSDRFNNNIFSLENIKVRTGSNGVADPNEWVSASYVRNGTISTNADDKTRALNVSLDFGDSTVRRFNKFSFFMQGGFDGVNLFDKEKTNLTNTAVKREMDDSSQNQQNGPTVSAYKKALDVLSNRSDVDVKLLAVPGIRHPNVTDKGIDVAEARFDALFLMDIEERDELNMVVTSSINQKIDVGNTVADFKNRALDSSFASAYFPDVIMTDPGTRTNVRVPPSVAVLGAFALNDAISFPWFAPAGFTRGALQTVQEVAVKLNRKNLDDLYEADINPLTSFPGSDGVVVWGQKTLKATQSALDRVNVRRLLIEVRREVRQVANQFLFEPNRESTLARFENQVRPRLRRIQELNGVDKFKVQIDTSTTTTIDIENNTMRGIISIVPTRSVEFINLDFVITNAGISFS